MLYIFPTELAAWATRVAPDAAQLEALCWITSELVTAAGLGHRTLAVAAAHERLPLGRGLSAELAHHPIRSVESVRVREVRPIPGGGLAPSARGWVDLTAADIARVVDTDLGRLEVYSPVWDGYARFRTDYSPSRRWECDIRYTAGHLATTTVASAVTSGETVLPVAATDHFAVGQEITVGVSATLYTIESIQEGVSLTIAAPGIDADRAAGDAVQERVPRAVKLACGLTLEDHQTMLPNAVRQDRRLDVLRDSLVRASDDPLPAAAYPLLRPYRPRLV